jgi:hypothetical protein
VIDRLGFNINYAVFIFIVSCKLLILLDGIFFPNYLNYVEAFTATVS